MVSQVVVEMLITFNEPYINKFPIVNPTTCRKGTSHANNWISDRRTNARMQPVSFTIYLQISFWMVCWTDANPKGNVGRQQPQKSLSFHSLYPIYDYCLWIVHLKLLIGKSALASKIHMRTVQGVWGKETTKAKWCAYVVSVLGCLLNQFVH